MALSESDLQIALMRWCETQMSKFPELKWIHHISNGGRRDSREAMSLKSQGVKAGVLDLHLPVSRGGFHGLMLELKRPGSKCKPPSKEQIEYISFLEEQGYCTIVSNDFVQLKELIVNYLEGRECRI